MCGFACADGGGWRAWSLGGRKGVVGAGGGRREGTGRKAGESGFWPGARLPLPGCVCAYAGGRLSVQTGGRSPGSWGKGGRGVVWGGRGVVFSQFLKISCEVLPEGGGSPRPRDPAWSLSLGADSPFFALLGSAPHELKTGVLEIARTKSKQILYCALAVETLYPRMAVVPTIRTIFSLRRLVVVDTQYIYGMQHFLYWRMQVLLLCGGHQKVIDVVGDGTRSCY
jgi:hypothetical protein